jgi:hypothetical protein
MPSLWSTDRNHRAEAMIPATIRTPEPDGS